MRLIGLAVVLALGVALAPVAAKGQATGQIRRMGLLNAAAPGGQSEPALRDALRALRGQEAT
jgi:hypothetical protein